MDIPEYSIRKILEDSPSRGTLYVLLTHMKDDGRFNLVIQECLKALSHFPDDLTLRKILAEAYLEDGRLLEAETEFEKVIKGIKSLAGVFRSQADIYLLQKREDTARESLGHFLSFFPENQEAASLLKELETATDISPAEIKQEEEEPDIAEQQEPSEIPGIITASLAETYFNQGKYSEAREIYERLAEKNPEDAALGSRIDEIDALMNQKPEEGGLAKENKINERKERMISILDTWRSHIRSLAKEGLTAG